MRVCYVSSSKFEAQFVRDSLMRGPERGMFVDFYQQMDMLIIDDIQGLIGKTKTQQAFFDIFNHLYLLGKQIIVTCGPSCGPQGNGDAYHDAYPERDDATH